MAMSRIENVAQLHAEIARLKGKVKEQEKDLRNEMFELKDKLKPVNLLVSTLSGLTGIKISGKEFMKDGIAIGLALLAQRFILKTERKLEHKVYDFIDSLMDKVRVFMEKFAGPEARRSERRQDDAGENVE